MRSSSLPYLIKEGGNSIVRRVFMSFASVFVIMACLLIMGTCTLLAFNVHSIVTTLENDNQIVAYVDDALTDEEAMALSSQLEQIQNVKKVTFVSNSQALDEFIATYDDSELLENVQPSVLRHRYLLHLDGAEGMRGVMQAAQQVTGIAKVIGYLEVAQGFAALRNVITAVTVLLTAVMFVVSLFIMTNTIKLTTVDRKEEIAIMKMVGATSGFIRLPFVIAGLYLGLFGSLVGFLLQWGLYDFMTSRIAQMGLTFIHTIPFRQVAFPVLAVFLVVGLAVGVLGSLSAIRQYLRV